MIKVFCQFSYGGYKIFRINGVPHEELQRRVIPGAGNDSIPEAAARYFNYGGAKIIYRYIDNDTLILSINDIPGPEKDSEGRPVNFAIQFIGDGNDRDVLDSLTIRIANDIEKFSRELVAMFDLWGGLFFNGDKLAAIIKECEIKYDYNGDSQLLRIRERKGAVLLFVPFSDNYGRDEKVTSKLLTELALPNEAREEDRIIRLSDLMKIQFLLKSTMTKENDGDTETIRTKIEELRAENNHLRSVAAAANNELNKLKEKNVKFLKRICISGALVGIILFFLIITKCHTLSWIILAIITIFFSYKTFKLLKK